MSMTRTDFEKELRALLEAHASTTSNAGCIACERCERCTDSTFSVGCTRLVRSNYCKDSVDCADSSHLLRCTSCLSASHCTDCERCTDSAYLIKCIDMNGCTYCFGCVGLSKKDFHILNQPYDRQTYFEITGRLAREMRIG